MTDDRSPDQPTPLADPAVSSVVGHVRRAGDVPVAGVRVQAFDQDLAGPRLLGETTTDDAGAYRIEFASVASAPAVGSQPGSIAPGDALRRLLTASDTPPGRSPLGRVGRPPFPTGGPGPVVATPVGAVPIARQSVDLWVGVPDGSGDASAPGDGFVARSAIVFDAGAATTIDLEVADTPLPATELERVAAVAAPRLGGRALAELTAEQVATLGGDTRTTIAAVDAAVGAAQLAGQLSAGLGVVTDPATTSALFALRRADPTATLDDVLAAGPARWAATIERAVTDEQIPPLSADELARVDDALGDMRRRRRLDFVDPTFGSPVRDLLATMPAARRLDSSRQEALAATLDEAGDLADVTSSLQARGWEPATVNSVVRTLGLAEIAEGHAPLVAALQPADPDGQAAVLADLARLRRHDWEHLVDGSGGPPAPQPETAGTAAADPSYVDRLLRNVEVRMPTAVVAAGVADGRIPVAAASAPAVTRFLANAGSFRIGDDSLLARLSRPVAGDLDGIDADAVEAMRSELLRIERVVRTTPTLESAQHVLAAGYGSAREISLVHRQRFVDEMSAALPSAVDAGSIHDRATAANAAATALLLAHGAAFRPHLELPVMPTTAPPAAAASETTGGGVAVAPTSAAADAADPTATIEALFGSQDTCGCDGCSSMYSPGAYLVELLQLLDGGVRNAAGQTGLDVLLARRPDLGEIELTCANTDTQVPIADLVLEILEAPLAVGAFWNAFARGDRDAAGQIVAWAYDAVLDQGTLPAGLRGDLAFLGIEVGDDPAVVRLPDTGVLPRWRLTGNGWRLHVRGTGNPYRLEITIYPQSHPGASADDAIPRDYVRWSYDSFEARRYPWILPFALADAETDAWLDALHTSRRELADAFAGADRWTSVEAARVWMCAPVLAWTRLTTGVDDPWLDWGWKTELVADESGNGSTPWYSHLHVVSELCRRARIDVRQVNELLDTTFVQTAPGLAGRIGLSGDECDPAAMMVGDDLVHGWMGPSVVRRIYLFLRLAAQVGWTFGEVDSVIRAAQQATSMPVVAAPAASSLEQFTEAFLIELTNILRLTERLQLPVDAVVNLFRSRLDTTPGWDRRGDEPRAVPSFYERLFDDPVVVRPRAPGLALSPDRSELAAQTPINSELPRLRLLDYAAEIAAALSCNRADIPLFLGAARPSIAATLLGTATRPAVDGEWVDVGDTPGAQIEWIVGLPTDAAAQFRLTIQQQRADGTVSDVGAPIVVAPGNNSWRRIVVALAGAGPRVRMHAERTSAAVQTVWLSARVLTSSGLVAEDLTLAGLTQLCGHLRLAKAAKMSAADYVALAGMSGIDPLGGPAAALALLDERDRLRATGLTVGRLDWLLRERFADRAAADAAGQRIADMLDAARQKLQTSETELRITRENAVALTRALLLELGWSDRLADMALGVAGLGRVFPTTHDAPLAALPGALVAVLPPGFAYDSITARLAWSTRGVAPADADTVLANDVAALVGAAEYAQLDAGAKTALDTALTAIGAAANSIAQDAIETASLVAELAKSIRLPVHEVAFAGDPASTPIPAEWSGSLWFEPSTGSYRFSGPLPAAWQPELSAIAGTPPASPFRVAVQALRDASAAYIEPPGGRPPNRLVDPEPAGALTATQLLAMAAPADRCIALLGRIVPVARLVRSTRIVERLLTDGFDVDEARAAVLVERFRHTDGATTLPLVGGNVGDGWLVTQPFLQPNPADAVAAAAFPEQVRALTRLAKYAGLAADCALDARALPWLFGGWSDPPGRFDFSALPTDVVAGPAPAWDTWSAFARLLALRDADVPGGQLDLVAVRQIAGASTTDAARLELLAAELGVGVGDLATVTTSIGARPLSALLDERRLERLVGIVALLRRTGADATTFDLWRAPASPTGALRARQLARARIGERQWATASRPVLDGLRVARRTALVEDAVERRGVRDANDLFGLLLVDPLMGPTAMSTRIRLAISSVQTFIHRIVMNLEPDVAPAAIDAEQWSWMANYRVWEANRKVLLYPENWLEPDLRPDATPLFKALTSRLGQDEADDVAAEDALRTYVDGLGDLSRIKPIATFTEFAANGTPVRTHLLGRSRREPFAHSYRTFVKRGAVTDPSGDWTPWEDLPADIEGDHVAPIVWRGRLFVVWALLDQAAAGAQQASTGATVSPPRTVWSMKLAWSERRNGSWTSRRLSSTNIVAEAALPADVWSPKDFYLIASPQARGVVVDVHLNTLWAGRLPADTIWRTFHPMLYPVASVAFDGDEMRVVAAIVRTTNNGADSFTYRAASSDVDGVTVRTDVGTGRGDAMSTPFVNYLGFTIGSDVHKALTNVPRANRLIVAPDETGTGFRAPSAVLNMGGKPLPYVFHDTQRAFFVYPTNRSTTKVSTGPNGLPWILLADQPQLQFTALDHPQTPRFRQRLHDGGVDGLLDTVTQSEPAAPDGVRGGFSFYVPAADIVPAPPTDDVEFGPTQPTGPYNWELFFHTAFAAGVELSRNHRFADARAWFHHVFNPTDSGTGPTPARYWRFRPFRELGAGPPIAELVRRIADPADQSSDKRDFLTTIAQWREDPFEPHLVARLRPRAYMYAVVMRYLDNLLDWADQLFRRDSMEALDEATQLYVLAAQILGRRPESIPRRTRPAARSFAELRSGLAGDAGALGDPLVIAENLAGSNAAGPQGPRVPLPKTLYFCVPDNPKLLSYFDIVADRLHKLRNSMNIDGVVRQLALYDPPIDPAMLVRARAAGIDLSSVLADANAPLPLYRFAVMSRVAGELSGAVGQLGAALLGALDRRDAEGLARLRSSQEVAVLASVRATNQLQVDEARAQIEVLGPVLENAQARLAYYVGLVSQVEELAIPGGPAGPTIASIAAAAVDVVADTLGITSVALDPISAAATDMLKQALSRASALISPNLPEDSATAKVPMNAAEHRYLGELKSARDEQVRGTAQRAAARFFSMIPDITLGSSGAMGSPVVTAQLGGTLLSKAAELFATATEGAAAEHGYRANLASILAGYQRRAAEWMQQAEAAGRDIEQITKQVAAATVRAAIVANELRTQDLRIEQADATDAMLRDKFTNTELYSWTAQQLSDTHFRAYQLAYDVAKRAEQAYRHELGLASTDFVRFGYWTSMRQGLTAGEQLGHDVRRMQAAYLGENRRELEITKHVSLRQLDPEALLRLRSGAWCDFEIPEALFDLDFPGHYFRRIKTVGVSVPCVVGPYTGVNGTLTLLSSKVRAAGVVVNAYDDDANLTTSRVPIQSIATSSGQNDPGLFELNFHDDRYLPFEGAGAVSRWRFKLPKDFRPFDYTTISDVVVHLRYTARDGGELLATAASRSLADRLDGLVRAETTDVGLVQLLSLRFDFDQELQRHLVDHSPLILSIGAQHFPYMFRGRVTPVSAAIVWDGDGTGIALEPQPMLAPTEAPLIVYQLDYAETSPLNTVADPYLIVRYTV